LLVVIGRLTAVAGWVLALGALGVVTGGNDFGGDLGRFEFRAAVCIPAALIGGVVAFLGQRTWTRGRRYLAASADDILTHDGRRPVLYLRAFKDDLAAGASLEYLPFRRGISEEEILQFVFHEIGPPIAVGRPGEVLPQLGAARLDGELDDWRRTVSDLMARARLTVVRVGDSPGIQWELSQAFAQLEPERLVLLLPFGPIGYERFRQDHPELRPLAPLADRDESSDNGRHRVRIRSILYFDREWTPHLVPIPLTKRQPLFVTLADALRPVFARLRWDPPVPTPAGWYRDPCGRFRLRYWDGTEWTWNVVTRGVNARDDPSCSGSPAQPRRGRRLKAPSS
jgi:hypothetical protein